MKIPTQNELVEAINGLENEDENVDLLGRLAEYYCSNYEMCRAFKFALINEINDQYENHYGEIEGDAERKIINDINTHIKVYQAVAEIVSDEFVKEHFTCDTREQTD